MKPGIYVVKMFYGEDKLHLAQRDENAHWKMFGGTLRFSNQQGWADNDVAENVLAGPFTPEQIAALPRLVDKSTKAQSLLSEAYDCGEMRSEWDESAERLCAELRDAIAPFDA
jgi:hypothetical protein